MHCYVSNQHHEPTEFDVHAITTHYDLKALPKTQVATNAAPFQRSLLILLPPNVAAFWRRTISLRWGWRHLPGVRDSPGVGIGVDAGRGVEGRDCDAIGLQIHEEQEHKAKTITIPGKP